MAVWVKEHSEVFFIKELLSFMRTQTSLPNHLSKAPPPPNTSHWGLSFTIWICIKAVLHWLQPSPLPLTEASPNPTWLQWERLHFYFERVLVELSKDFHPVKSALHPFFKLDLLAHALSSTIQLAMTMFAAPMVISYTIVVLTTITGSLHICRISQISPWDHKILESRSTIHLCTWPQSLELNGCSNV